MIEQSMQGKVPISVLVITKNEESNIRECLESFRWAAEIIIVDSYSTDGTVEIAREYTDKIYLYKWDGKNPKKNWSLETPIFAHDWILMPDADERSGPGFKDELQGIVADHNHHLSGYMVRYHYWFLGKYLRFGDPVRKVVLFRRSRTRFEHFDVGGQAGIKDMETGHEHPIIDGAVGNMKSPLLHADRRPLHFYFDRHNRYSTWEASRLLRRPSSREKDKELRGGFGGGSLAIRRFLKNIFLSMPCKPVAYFIYGYIIRLGFLDGYPGLCYNVCKSIYAYEIGLKLYELRLKKE